MTIAPCNCKLTATESKYFWQLLDCKSFISHPSYRAVAYDGAEDAYETLVLDRSVAFHEAGHAVAAVAAGAIIHAVAIGAHPVCLSVYPETATHLVRLIGLAAGLHCESLVNGPRRPSDEKMHNHVALARSGEIGSCDNCKSARLLCESFPELSDAELVNAWRSAFQLCAALFRTPAWETALLAVAGALRDRFRINGDDVAALVDADALRTAQSETFGDADLSNPENWWRM